MRQKTVNGGLDLRNIILFSEICLFILAGCGSRSFEDESDNISPEPGGGGVLNFSNVACCSLTLSWTPAEDNADNAGDLQYKVIQLESETDKSGVMILDWSRNLNSANITGLICDAGHYFNVLVKDTHNNEAAYKTAPIATSICSLSWARSLPATPWPMTVSNNAVTFKDNIWILGGASDGVYNNDVWYSDDGSNWSETTSKPPWSARFGHSGVVFQDKIWVLGGYDVNPKNDVWHSNDGINWLDSTLDAPWSARFGHSSVVFNGKMWIIGGSDNPGQMVEGHKGDVWYSSDVKIWTEATSDVVDPCCVAHSSVVFDGKMWIIGGGIDKINNNYFMNKVWYSSDGEIWTEATSDAGWPARYWHSGVVFQDKIWILGGGYDDNNEQSHMFNDVWYSGDGATWKQPASASPWVARMAHGGVVFQDKIWILGGMTEDNATSDIWRAE